MKLEIFFKKFDEFADAPNAVENMRELVLELAVQGKIVQQDPNDAPAEELLQKIELTQSRTGMTAKGRKLESLPPVDPDNSPYETPHGWAWCRLGTLGLISSSCRVHQKDWTSNGVPFLRAREIVKLSKFGQVDNDLFISEEHYRRLATEGLTPEPNDLMITGVGTIGVPYVVRDADRFYFKDASVLIFKNWFGLYPHYLRIVMQSPYWIREVHRESMGTTVHTLTIVRAKLTPIPLPPLDEQKRIVAKVDELMALCDRLSVQQQERETRHAALARTSLARFADAPTPVNLRFLFYPSYDISPADFRKSILTLAVQGRLVPQDTNDEPAEELLQTVAKLNPNAGREFGEPPFSLPHGWIWLRAASVFEVAGGIQKTPHRTPRNNAFPYLGVGNVYRGRLDLTSVKEFELEPGELERRRLKAGDLLIIEGNGSLNEIGRCAKWNGEIENCVHQNHVIRCRPSDARICDFVLLFLNSPNGIEIMQRLAITSSGLYSLSVGKIRQIEIPIPPLAEQRRIVAKVKQLMALVDELETQLAASRATAANLVSALVAELTTQA